MKNHQRKKNYFYNLKNHIATVPHKFFIKFVKAEKLMLKCAKCIQKKKTNHIKFMYCRVNLCMKSK